MYVIVVWVLKIAQNIDKVNNAINIELILKFQIARSNFLLQFIVQDLICKTILVKDI